MTSKAKSDKATKNSRRVVRGGAQSAPADDVSQVERSEAEGANDRVIERAPVSEERPAMEEQTSIDGPLSTRGVAILGTESAASPVNELGLQPASDIDGGAEEAASTADEADAEDDAQEEGDEDAPDGEPSGGVDGPKKNYQWRMRQLSRPHQIAAKLREFQKRCGLLAADLLGFEVNEAALADTFVAIRADTRMLVDVVERLAAVLEKLPADFKPKRALKSAAARREYVVGDRLRIGDKFIAFYDGVLTPEEAQELTVFAAEPGKPKVVCTTKSDVRVGVARVHLRPLREADDTAPDSEPTATAEAS